MSDATALPPDSAKAASASKSADVAAKAPEEWKPEPRKWTWKDLFTAPMLAFKPKCMLVSAATMVAIFLWMWILGKISADAMWHDVLVWVWSAVAVVIFSVGATFVSVFMKADLLDDEFLSFGEALAQYKNRLVPAFLVPIFLIGLLSGFKLLIGLADLVASIPYAGPTLYAIAYPLGYALSLFVVLLTIAVFLSVFVFPSIIAIRKHGWFDNVVDTFEAVGTKPHILIASLILTGLMIWVAQSIGYMGMSQLKESTLVMPEWGSGLRETEDKATELKDKVIGPIETFAMLPSWRNARSINLVGPSPMLGTMPPDGYEANFTGVVTGIWQILISAFILGYCMNLFVAGGMLTYLIVREDDYWDDEDLADLDQLAKELEEEAKQDAAKSSAAPSDKPSETPPATPPAS